MINIKIINKGHHPLPAYETSQSAGMDLRANIDKSITIHPMERILIPTGLFMALPPGFEAQIRPRSGLALKHGITVLNSPGTIDADYRSEIGVILKNGGLDTIWIEDGERICQFVLNKVERIDWNIVESLDKTERNGGFGSTNLDKNGNYIASK